MAKEKQNKPIPPESRSVPMTIERRSEGEGDDTRRVLHITAAVYNQYSQLMWNWRKGYFREQILPGAFDEVLADPNLDCVATLNHNNDILLGRTSADPATLTLTSTERGLEGDIVLPNDVDGDRAWEKVGRGDLRHCSFQFIIAEGGDSWVEDEKFGLTRDISNVKKLLDVTLAVRPAYIQTDAAKRSAEKFYEEQEPVYESELEARNRHLRLLEIS